MKLNKRIIVVMVAVLSLFFVSVTNLVLNMVYPSEELLGAVEGEILQEEQAARKKILRGKIYDRNGNVLAYSETIDSASGVAGQNRVYPYKELFAHTVGFYRGDYAGGSDYLERRWDEKLMAVLPEDEDKVRDVDNKDVVEGASLGLTLDYGMTEYASELLDGNKYPAPSGSKRGSIIVMNPTTGEIYCMYSSPSFDPSPDVLKEKWTEYSEDPDTPFYSRATRSKQVPGSVFKIITAIAAVEAGEGRTIILDEGKANVAGTWVYNYDEKANGEIGLKTAIEKSSNVYFAKISQQSGTKNQIPIIAEKFFLGKDDLLTLDIPITDPKIDFENMSNVEIAATAYGQGVAEVTPLHMAMVASAVANDGTLMKPYLVESATYSNGEVLYEATPEVLSDVMKPSTASFVTDGMIASVETGTGTAAQVSGITVAGKTGTAELSTNGTIPDNTWFIGFAPAENPQVAICVMREKTGGFGGNMCGRIAADMIRYCRDNGFITE